MIKQLVKGALVRLPQYFIESEADYAFVNRKRDQEIKHLVMGSSRTLNKALNQSGPEAGSHQGSSQNTCKTARGKSPDTHQKMSCPNQELWGPATCVPAVCGCCTLQKELPPEARRRRQ
jgi:hypothetical protein